jgi:hypothetical protein
MPLDTNIIIRLSVIVLLTSSNPDLYEEKSSARLYLKHIMQMSLL